MIPINRLEQSLPMGFSFYGLGEVSRQAKAQPCDWTQLLSHYVCPVGISYQLLAGQAPQDFLLMLLIESELDQSMYAELGNIIASRLASELGYDITPPRFFTQQQLNRLILPSGMTDKQVVCQTYTDHCQRNLRIVMIPYPGQEMLDV